VYQNIYVSYPTDTTPSQVYLWDDEKGLQVLPYYQFRYAYKPDAKGKYRSMRGDRLSKVKKYDFGDTDLYESDVGRETRVLTDLYLNDDTPSKGHRVGVWDIEVDSQGGFASWQNPFQEITAVAFYDQASDEFFVFVLDKDKQIEHSQEGNKFIFSFDNERDLLLNFLDLYSAVSPTILTGWNTDGYDIPYFYHRVKLVLGESHASRLSPVGVVTYNPNREKYQIAGVSSLDYLTLYKKFTYSQKPSYRLDAIGKDEVDMGKVEYEGPLHDLYRTDLKKFIAYNLQDVEIVVAIDKKMKLIELARFICHIGHVPYEDFTYSSKFIEGTILTYLHRKGIIASNKPLGGRDQFNAQLASHEDGFAGAFVKEPTPGLYEWVFSLDLQSLYPSIIMSLNISPETKVGKVLHWDVEAHVTDKVASYQVIHENKNLTMTRAEFDDFLKTKRLNISSNGILYITNRTGIIPEILDQWFNARKEFKDLMKKYVKEGNTELADFYDRRQHVQKILLNSIYGVLGLPIFRFYDLDNAAAVTLSGQDIIKTTAKYINSQYKLYGAKPEDSCIYIDTDSVYFSAKPLMEVVTRKIAVDMEQLDKEFTISIAREMETKTNKFYDVVAKMLFNCDTHRFFIKGESVMKTGFWVAKKRYAMKKVFDLETNKDMDKLAVKGLDVVRSSFPKAFSDFMTWILTAILDKTPKDVIDKQILEFYYSLPKMSAMDLARRTSVNGITKYTIPNEVSLHSFMNKTPIHVKSALIYNRLLKKLGIELQYTPIRDGDKIRYVYLLPNEYGIEVIACKTYNDPPEVMQLIEQYIDHVALFDKELAHKLEDFFAAMKWGLIPTQINQTALEFFSF
jgi:DNA polymerase elongation subunit (family B)